MTLISQDDLCNPWFSGGYIFCGQLYTFSKQLEVSLFPLANGGRFAVPLALQANRTIILSLEFFPPLQGSSIKLTVLLDVEAWRKAQSPQHYKCS
jgi:hypothetical protein